MSDEYAEKATWAEPEVDRAAQIEKRLTELDQTIERLQHQTEMVDKRMQTVMRPSEPSGTRPDLTAMAASESPLSERIASASRRVEMVADHLADLVGRCDL